MTSGKIDCISCAITPVPLTPLAPVYMTPRICNTLARAPVIVEILVSCTLSAYEANLPSATTSPTELTRMRSVGISSLISLPVRKRIDQSLALVLPPLAP